METDIPAGKYILAVSGGVDSMVLLDLLSKLPGIELVVAHFDHGIRKDSYKDSLLVRNVANKYGLKFETVKGKLGKNASEDTAREARYRFLEQVKENYKADAIITAHHQDDLIETAIMNLLRGTGPRGIVAMAENKNIIRPLLKFSKTDILDYAKQHDIAWREDYTNQDTRYLRNYIRQNLIPKLDDKSKQKLVDNIDSISKVSQEKARLINQLDSQLMKNGLIDRSKFINLPNEVGHELLVYWLRQLGVRDFDNQTIMRLSLALKTAKSGTKHDIMGGLWLQVATKSASFEANR